MFTSIIIPSNCPAPVASLFLPSRNTCQQKTGQDWFSAPGTKGGQNPGVIMQHLRT